ncbi:MAG: hypothetical protein V1772_10560 [Chloroflexota bacterium]
MCRSCAVSQRKDRFAGGRLSAYTIRPYGLDVADAVTRLQVEYARACPGAQVVPPQVYAHPAFAQGASILRALALC